MLATIIQFLACQDRPEKLGCGDAGSSQQSQWAGGGNSSSGAGAGASEKGRGCDFWRGQRTIRILDRHPPPLCARMKSARKTPQGPKGGPAFTICDPKKNPQRKRRSKITYLQALQQQLKVMDSDRILPMHGKQMPIVV